MISKMFISSAVVAMADAGKCPFGYGSSDQAEAVQLNAKTKEGSGPLYPSQILTCPASKTEVLKTPAAFSKAQYEQIALQVIERHDEISERKDQIAFAGCLVRLEGHDFMDFRRVSRTFTKGKHKGKTMIQGGAKKLSGGSDGCVNFEDEDNAGLPTCLQEAQLGQIYGMWCDKVSLADFMVIAAEAVMGRLAVDYDAEQKFAKSDSLLAKFRDSFKHGRQTLKECPEAKGLMPNPERGCNDLQEIFLKHIYNVRAPNGKWCHDRCKWNMVAAISGAHTIGSAKAHNSGYVGNWSDEKNQGIFNNNYYKAILGHGWGVDRAIGGNEGKNAWKRVDIMLPGEPQEMMLNTDMCLAYQYNQLHIDCMKQENRSTKKCVKYQKKGRFINAKTDNCCAWTQQNVQFKKGIISEKKNDFCGMNTAAKGGSLRGACCLTDKTGDDCDAFDWPKGPAFNLMLVYASSNDEFYKAFLNAWHVGTENGMNE